MGLVLAISTAGMVEQVLVVDSDSTDGTAEIARQMGAEVLQEPRRGYGGACLTLLGDAPDVVVFLDGDYSDRSAAMSRLLEPLWEGGQDGSATRGAGVHRVRQQLVKSRTALINQVRGLLAEHGIVIPQGHAQLHHGLALILEDTDQRLSGLMREILSESSERLKFIEARLHQYELQIERPFRRDPRCRRLAQVAGVGPRYRTGGGSRQCG
jgi:hypothetical protein